MLFLVRNAELITNKERTYLTAAVAVGGTTLTVRAVDSNAWADNDWVIVGEVGTKNAEILQANGAVSDGTSLVVDNAGSGGARFAHAINEPVYRIDLNQVFFYHNTIDSTTGLTTLASNRELQVDDEYTRYDDTTQTSGYGFLRFYNSQTAAYSAYSEKNESSDVCQAGRVNRVRLSSVSVGTPCRRFCRFVKSKAPPRFD